MTDTFAVSEIFGPTVQGEGPTAGQRCGFLRLSMCNLDCRWCDTPYTWDWTGKNGTVYDRKTEQTRMTPAAVAAEVVAMGVDLLVITGGEPLIQRQRISQLLDILPEEIDVEIETNGTRDPGDLGTAVRWNVSPKLAHSGVDRGRAITENLGHYIHDDTAFKFVVQDVADLAEIEAICADHGIPRRLVWIMPEGRRPDELAATMARIATAAVDAGYNLTSRLQVLAWGDTRGT